MLDGLPRRATGIFLGGESFEKTILSLAASLAVSSMTLSGAKQALVEIDPTSCRRLAELLSSRHVPRDEEEIKLEGPAPELVGNFFLALVAICHQTSPHNGPPLEGTVKGLHLWGWDYLLGRFDGAVKADSSLVQPTVWAAFSAADLANLFRDHKYGETLTDPNGRTALLRDLGLRMLQQGWRFADQIHELCGRRVATGRPNLLDTLAQFRAYRDPVHKKSLFFLSLMRNSGTWTYEDGEGLGPPVDYHEVRGHLRIGTVRVNSPELLDKLYQNKEVSEEEDIAIRLAVFDAIVLISQLTGVHNPSQLHYMFWNVFRSLCTRQSPQCLGLRSNSRLPARYAELTVQADGRRRCPFSPVCVSSETENRLVEQVFETDYY